MISIQAAIAAAGVDPYALQAQLTAGSPDSIVAVARAFADAGGEASTSFQRSRQAHAQVGAAFTNDGAAVLDVAGQTALARRQLGGGGEDLQQAAALLKTVATALEGATAASGQAVRGMEDELETLRRAWNRFVAQPGVQVTASDEQQLMSSAVKIVQSAGQAVQTQIDGYDAVLGHGTGVLGALGYTAALGPDDPGQPGGSKYAVGPPTRPPLKFDDDFVYDPDADASLGDRWRWAEWGAKADGARLLRPDLDDSLDLYGHYRDGTGTPMTVDYEEGYREDPSIARTVDTEIASARAGVEQLHATTGSGAFSFTGDAAGVPRDQYPETENWQKTLGGYQVWSSGDVRIQGNHATMTVTVHAEDRYNFNRGQADIASGTPDDVNGRFAELGWAKSFDVNGTVTRTVSWDLGSAAPPTVSGGEPDRDPGGEDRVDGRGGGR